MFDARIHSRTHAHSTHRRTVYVFQSQSAPHTHTHAHSLSLSGGGPHNNVGITSWMSRVAEPGETCWRATLVPRRQRKRRRDDGNATRGSRGYSGTTDRCRRRVQRRVCVTTHEVYIYIYTIDNSLGARTYARTHARTYVRTHARAFSLPSPAPPPSARVAATVATAVTTIPLCHCAW